MVYLVRGSITKGKFCKTNCFIYGKALLDAVYIEENVAIYPRVIVDKSLFKIIDSKSEFIAKDFYINSLYYLLNDCYKSFKRKILKQLQENEEKKRKTKNNMVY